MFLTIYGVEKSQCDHSMGPFSSEYAKQNANQLSSKLARLALTGAICEMKKLGKTA